MTAWFRRSSPPRARRSSAARSAWSGSEGPCPVPVRIGAVQVGLEPVSVAARTNNEAWVVNNLSDDVSIVDLGTLHVSATLGVGDEPNDVVFAGASNKAYV